MRFEYVFLNRQIAGVKNPHGAGSLEIEMGDLLFELHGPNGEIWKLYANGFVEGFPHGTIVVNHAMPLIHALVAQQIPCANIADKQA